MKDTMSYFQEAYDIAFNAGMEDERTRIIKALEGLKEDEPYDFAMKAFNNALDQAIKAVEKGNK